MHAKRFYTWLCIWIIIAISIATVIYTKLYTSNTSYTGIYVTTFPTNETNEKLVSLHINKNICTFNIYNNDALDISKEYFCVYNSKTKNINLKGKTKEFVLQFNYIENTKEPAFISVPSIDELSLNKAILKRAHPLIQKNTWYIKKILVQGAMINTSLFSPPSISMYEHGQGILKSSCGNIQFSYVSSDYNYLQFSHIDTSCTDSQIQHIVTILTSSNNYSLEGDRVKIFNNKTKTTGYLELSP